MHLKNLFGTSPLPKYICQLEISGYPLHGIVDTIGICPGKNALGIPSKEGKNEKGRFKALSGCSAYKIFFC